MKWFMFGPKLKAEILTCHCGVVWGKDRCSGVQVPTHISKPWKVELPSWDRTFSAPRGCLKCTQINVTNFSFEGREDRNNKML